MAKEKEILLYGTFGTDWWTGEGITAKQFYTDFSSLESDPDCDVINVRINSPGGSVFEGVAIYNIIASAKKETNTYIDGIAYSMGAICALAGKKVFMAQNATMLLHNVSGWAMGNASDFRQALEMIEALDESLCGTIATKTGLTKEEVKAKWMDYKDHTLTADAALESKLVDEVLNEKKTDKVPANIKTMSMQEVFAYYGHINQENKKSFVEEIIGGIKNMFSAQPKPQEEQVNNKKVYTMTFEKSLDLLNKAQLTPEDVAEIKNEIAQYTGANEKFTVAEVTAKVEAAVAEKVTEVTNLTNEVADLKAEVAALKTPAQAPVHAVGDPSSEIRKPAAAAAPKSEDEQLKEIQLFDFKTASISKEEVEEFKKENFSNI